MLMGRLCKLLGGRRWKAKIYEGSFQRSQDSSCIAERTRLLISSILVQRSSGCGRSGFCQGFSCWLYVFSWSSQIHTRCGRKFSNTSHQVFQYSPFLGNNSARRQQNASRRESSWYFRIQSSSCSCSISESVGAIPLDNLSHKSSENFILPRQQLP